MKSKSRIKFSPRLLLTSKAAEYIGVSAQTLRNWGKEGKLTQHSTGFFSREELDRFTKNGPLSKGAQ
jgi:predicted site-specific integrase-resolvase